VGAQGQETGGVHFRVWAPRRERVEVLIGERGFPLVAEGGGYFSGLVAQAHDGTLYRYRLDGDHSFPDPASRFQPDGPHGPSRVVDPGRFAWTDGDWRGCTPQGQVIYEMHVGTFTPEGTWASAAAQLPEMAALGVTVLEVMPVAEFAGTFGWGYDGVDLYAPTRLYGEPDDFRRFVDRAHALGLAVILDVVYNHLGPDGAYLKEFSPDYYTDRYVNDWGEPINFDGDNNAPVRELFIANAGYWIDEYHLDGLRLDATQQIFDASEVHLLREIGRSVRDAAKGRPTFIVAENEPQHVRIVRPAGEQGYGIDALWNDDYHHSAMVALTGRNEAYYSDHQGTPQELISAMKWGYLYQGQRYSWQKQRRGTPAFGLPPWAFVNFIQNHDQIANTALGLRAHFVANPGRYRALTALTLLSPGTPMLFQGQEFCSSAPFLFFADHEPLLAAAVRKGRAEFMKQFPSVASEAAQAALADPSDPQTFLRCKLDFSERESHAAAYALHRDLLALRRDDAAFSTPRPHGMDGAVLGQEAFVLRFFTADGADRLLLVNLGRDLDFTPCPEPLLAPLEGSRWETLWSSEDPRYGGGGMSPVETDDGWKIPGQAAMVLAPKSLDP
jgi:maltooligosyltrehalose trehalohydrolase